MGLDLLENLNRILTEKNTKIIPSNIRKDVTIFDITGTSELLNAQSKIVVPTLSKQTITPDDDYNALSQVTVNAVTSAVDSHIQAENIKKNVTILGVTGTYEGSGGGSSITNGVYFLDYDGTIIETWDAINVADKTELPNNPTHEGLVAEGWNWTLQSIKNYIENYPNSNIYVGQTYHSSSGLIEIGLTLTKLTGLTMSCRIAGNKNWGDGTTDNLTSHTYEDYGNYTITCDGTSIPNSCYSDNVMIKSIILSNNVTSIGSDAFNSCSLLEKVILSNSVINITGTYNFRSCRSLKNIVIPNSITTIPNYCLMNCYLLKCVSLPSTITSIAGSSFSADPELTYITLPEGITSFGSFANSSLENITIPNSVTSIGTNTFENCKKLKTVTLPNSINTINNAIFTGCSSLEHINIPNNITTINREAFNNCTALNNVVFPSNLTTIENNAFAYCYSATKYDFSNCISIPTLGGSGVFQNRISGCKIIVPDVLYEDWILAYYWTSLSNIIIKASDVL